MTTHQLAEGHNDDRGPKRFLPFLSWIGAYDRRWLSADAIAGLTLWGMVVPEAMAYAGVAGLIVLFGYIALSAALGLHAGYNVEVVGELPQGVPSLGLPSVSLNALLAMIVPAIGVLLLAFSEALGVGHDFAVKHGYEIDPLLRPHERQGECIYP